MNPQFPFFVLQGAKSLKRLQDLLDQLPPLGVPGQIPHPNQTLFFRDVVVAYLLAFFNPTLQSLRLLQDFSATPKGQKHFEVPQVSRFTFSDLVARLPGQPLQMLVSHLIGEAQRKGQSLPADLPAMLQHVLAVDGTFLNAASDMAWALGRSARQPVAAQSPASPNEPEEASAPRSSTAKAKIRLDWHVNIDNWLPEVISVHGDEASETDNALANIQPQAVHLYDRGIFSFELVEAHVQTQAPFVMRVRMGERCPKFVSQQSRPLTEKDLQAGVVSDTEGGFCGSSHRSAPAARLREILVDTPQGRLRLVTTLWDVEAWVIVLLYRYRWQVELFFRWLKTYARWTHLMNHSRSGVEIQMYAAVVGILLVYLECGGKPSKHSYALFSQVISGDATLEEILPILARRERENALARARRKRLRDNPEAPRRRYGLSSR